MNDVGLTSFLFLWNLWSKVWAHWSEYFYLQYLSVFYWLLLNNIMVQWMLPNQQMSHVKILSDWFVNQLHHPEKHFSV